MDSTCNDADDQLVEHKSMELNHLVHQDEL